METLSYTPGRGRPLPQGANGQGQETNETSQTSTVGLTSEDQPSLDKIRMADAVRRLPPLMRAPGMHAPVLLTAGLMAFEQASGMTTLLYYSGESLFFLPSGGTRPCVLMHGNALLDLHGGAPASQDDSQSRITLPTGRVTSPVSPLDLTYVPDRMNIWSVPNVDDLTSRT